MHTRKHLKQTQGLRQKSRPPGYTMLVLHDSYTTGTDTDWLNQNLKNRIMSI